MSKLDGKTAIVTGGGSGIGEGIARALAGLGMNVVICGRTRKDLQRVAAEIRKEGGAVQCVKADVSRQKDVERLVDETVSRFGSVHVLVNNAGIGGGREIHEQDIAEWDEIMAIDLRGPFLMAKAVLPVMRRQKEGDIIQISSESGLEIEAGGGAYGVAKHALNALSEYIQVENQELGIRVNTICPGMVVTDMTKDRAGLNKDRSLYPEDVAELVVWLLMRRANIKIGRPILIQTMLNPWEAG